MYFVLRPQKSWFENKEQRIRDVSVVLCERLLANPHISGHPRSLARIALKKWQNRRLDPEPVLMFAVLARNERAKSPLLVLAMSDEDGDVASIEITERHFEAGREILLIAEEYPVFGYGLVTSSSRIPPVKIRRGDERKNEEAWQSYLDAGRWRIETIPTMWISLPEPGKTEIQVAVRDHAGHKSNAVPLDNTIPPAENRKTEKEAGR